jgi:cytochrome c peroxidase
MKNYILLSVFIALVSCKKDNGNIPQYSDKEYKLEYGDFPPPNIPTDNLLTEEGVKLGRMLFYEKKLSKDGTQSCASCHNQDNSFNDLRQFSIGVEGLPGKRNAMTIVNLAWHKNGFFWDGRASTLRQQSLKPIQDPLEMNEKLENAVSKLKLNKSYVDQFMRAFKDPEITADKISLALEQFMMTLVSFSSKYDQWKSGKIQLTDSEERGRKLFFAERDVLNGKKGAECFHCHNGFDFTNHAFTNNGLDYDSQFKDLGRFEVTNKEIDKARFKTPTLRNIELTSPYMHDGRFKTLEEVIEHYNSDVKFSSTLDPVMTNVAQAGLDLDENDKADLINFLKTLTDQKFISEPSFKDPFK